MKSILVGACINRFLGAPLKWILNCLKLLTTFIYRARATGSEVKALMKKEDQKSASELITKSIAELGDWRGETLSRMRKLIKEADPDVVEEWKWVKPTSPGTPVWSHNGASARARPTRTM